ncbi:MAG: hypothetical protein ABIE74_04855 [Pseudomonadota bacterium]
MNRDMLNKLELRRQFFHMLFGVGLVVLINVGILNFEIILILLLLGIVLSILSKRMKIPIVHWFLQRFEREDHLKKFPGKGVIFYLLGTAIIYGLFIHRPEGKNIIMASIMILALGDSAPLFVRHIARIRHPLNDKKFLEGAILGAFLGFIGAVIFVHPLEALIASSVAMFVEGIEIKLGMAEVDDNITIPFVAALVIWLVRLLQTAF